MITHNNLPSFDEEFYKNQIEILANQAFPEFNKNNLDDFASDFAKDFDYEKVIQTNFYETKEVSNFETFSNIKIVPQNSNSYEIFDVEAIRRDFPVLNQKVNGNYPLIWLDNAATTQKPKSVIDRIIHFYEYENSNIHRGAHTLAARATDAYEEARKKVAKFINAPSQNNIIFVRGATEAINLIAHSFGKIHIQKDDEIIVSNLEHHANIVPWQILSSQTGAKLKVIPVDNDGQILLNEFERLITPKTKIVSITHVSNALGTIVPIKQVIEIAHRYGVKVLIDGAQGVSHIKTDVQELDCDFYIFSGHKVFAPTGIGAIYAKKELLNIMQPYQAGGNMIADVTFEKTVYQEAPNKFEAGTGNIADAVGLGAALDYVSKIGIENIYNYEHKLLEYAIAKMGEITGLRFIGTAKEKTSVLSFVLDGYDTTKVGEYLTSKGIALRFGHHCAQPILRRFGVEATVRPSIAFYNTKEEIDFLVQTIKEFKNSSLGR
ncbi:SufS-like cysteine desulfurase [Aliarcobacter faecis]|uniref:family 2A encapsulin nanocompartment cargo protein cysteine desulfurase n=1 Tax=Aliarcobacter faecis TaxID=1564138 RepID=UPI0004AD0079|nr:family 2A encapsulin nanocompartment cargo protein cysteine desulfurase [Aliarcobacter faecis]QKF74431.1 SufS-like cysteine desulfurase [Aliarcobacter faecis]